jgi:hypothetical protein
VRFILAVAVLLVGCQGHPVESIHTKVAWDSDSHPVVMDGLTPKFMAATVPGTLWTIFYYPDDLPPFVCRQESGWRGLVEVIVTPDSIFHPADAARFEENCRVEWTGNFRIDGLAPTEGRVRLESMHLVPSRPATSKERETVT